MIQAKYICQSAVKSLSLRRLRLILEVIQMAFHARLGIKRETCMGYMKSEAILRTDSSDRGYVCLEEMNKELVDFVPVHLH